MVLPSMDVSGRKGAVKLACALTLWEGHPTVATLAGAAMADDVRTATRNATVLLAAIACGAALYLLRDILTPLALAVFLAVMIDGFARVLSEHTPFPDRASVPVAVVLSIALFGGAAYVIADHATSFAGQLTDYQPKLNALIIRVAEMLNMRAAPTLEQLYRSLDPSQYLGVVAKRLQSLAADAVFVLIYLGFILASRRGFRRKLVGMFPTHDERDYALRVFGQIRDGVERYLWVQTVTGVMIGVASFVIMLIVGLDNAVFWALLIFLASYIPVVGGFVGILLPPVFALVQFDTWWQAATLLVVLQTIQFIVGNVVQPRMQGDSLNIDPVVVLLSLAFWGLIWGLPGMFLSTPLTVGAMVILAQFPATRRLAVLLSENGNPQGVVGNPATAETTTTPAAQKPPSKPARRPFKASSKAPT
jgi:AI-2 transport protein TqsA